MRILDIILAPWAIPADRLLEIRDLYFAHTRREKIDLKAWEAATGRPAGSAQDPYQILDGVAILPVQGVLTKADSAWNRFCGMTSTALIRQNLQLALQDPQVQAILLHIDSPGGTVDGTQELADAIFAARGQKPIISLADGCMCSAACWVGCAADQVYITSDTAMTGSIGVVATHVDVSGSEAQNGRKTTEITAGKYKRISSSFAPLSEDGRAEIQAQLDHIYGVFVDQISAFRNVPTDTVLADMADGRVFLGKQAIEAGLVDGVSAMQALISSLSQGLMPSLTPPSAGPGAASQPPTPPEQETIMDLNELRDKHPELAQALTDAAATAERQRIQGCMDATIPGYEDQALAMAFDGKTSPGDCARAINAACRKDMQTHRAETTSPSAGPAPLPTAGDPALLEAAIAAEKTEAAKAKAKNPKAVWEADAALRADFANDFMAYESFLAAEANGQARRLVK